jgi:hypothetical protein
MKQPEVVTATQAELDEILALVSRRAQIDADGRGF